MMSGNPWSDLGSSALDLVNTGINVWNAEQNRDANRELAEEENALNKWIAEQNLNYQYAANASNIAMQQETNALNEKLMREGWARDDTARQRMVKDLESAGLSKWLATGASPMSSSPVSMGAPQVSPLHNDYKADYGKMIEANNYRADALSHLYSNFLNFENTRKQNELLDKQAAVSDMDFQIKAWEKMIKEHDATVLSNRQNSMSTDPATLKYIDEIVNALRGQKNGQILDIKKGLQSAVGDKVSAAKKQAERIKQELSDKAYNAMVDVADFVAPTPQAAPGQKPLSMSEWMAQNEYTHGDREKAFAYKRYVDNWYKSQEKRKRR